VLRVVSVILSVVASVVSVHPSVVSVIPSVVASVVVTRVSKSSTGDTKRCISVTASYFFSCAIRHTTLPPSATASNRKAEVVVARSGWFVRDGKSCILSARPGREISARSATRAESDVLSSCYSEGPRRKTGAADRLKMYHEGDVDSDRDLKRAGVTMGAVTCTPRHVAQKGSPLNLALPRFIYCIACSLAECDGDHMASKRVLHRGIAG
jgi:hypothetical protein